MQKNDIHAAFPLHMPMPDLKQSSASSLFVVLAVAGFILLATGILFIIFGPETIYYNTASGMTFVQVLQAYPGPIASVGGLFIGIANYGLRVSSPETKLDKAIQNTLSAAGVDANELPEGYELHADMTADNQLTIELRPVSNQADNHSNRTTDDETIRHTIDYTGQATTEANTTTLEHERLLHDGKLAA